MFSTSYTMEVDNNNVCVYLPFIEHPTPKKNCKYMLYLRCYCRTLLGCQWFQENISFSALRTNRFSPMSKSIGILDTYSNKQHLNWALKRAFCVPPFYFYANSILLKVRFMAKLYVCVGSHKIFSFMITWIASSSHITFNTILQRHSNVKD